MADYKDIITGTLSSLFSKAKDVADSVAGQVTAEGSSVRGMYEQGTSKAKVYAKIAKLTLEVNGDNEELKKVYTEIGRLCVEQFKDAPSEFFAPLFDKANGITARISDKEALIAELKASVSDAGADVDVEIEEFDDVVDSTASDGSAEDIKAAVEEAMENVREVVDDIIDDVKG